MAYQLSPRALRALLHGTGVQLAPVPPPAVLPEALLWSTLWLLHTGTAGLLWHYLVPGPLLPL